MRSAPPSIVHRRGLLVAAGLSWGTRAGATSAAPGLGHGWQDALNSAGPQAAHIQDLWRLMLWMCSIVFALVLAAFLLALWRAPRSRLDTAPDLEAKRRPEAGIRRTVATATVVSAALLFVLIVASVWTDRALARLSTSDALHIDVTAHQWWWELTYDDPDPSRQITTANEIHVPVGRPVLVTLHADDVIHSFWVPSLTGKMDLIPGQKNELQFTAKNAGIYRGQCAEFCGIQHAHMAFAVIAMSPDEFGRWRDHENQSASNPADQLGKQGEALFRARECALCHNISGTLAGGQLGPDLTHIGSRTTIAAGTLPNTPATLGAWIADPQHIKPGNLMPKMPLQSDELIAILHYLEQLK
jgi:cytochrome c oxidase subunit II